MRLRLHRGWDCRRAAGRRMTGPCRFVGAARGAERRPRQRRCARHARPCCAGSCRGGGGCAGGCVGGVTRHPSLAGHQAAPSAQTSWVHGGVNVSLRCGCGVRSGRHAHADLEWLAQCAVSRQSTSTHNKRAAPFESRAASHAEWGAAWTSATAPCVQRTHCARARAACTSRLQRVGACGGRGACECVTSASVPWWTGWLGARAGFARGWPPDGAHGGAAPPDTLSCGARVSYTAM